MTPSRRLFKRFSGPAIFGLALIACGGDSEGTPASYSGKTLSALTDVEAGDFCVDFVQLVESTLGDLETLLVELPCEITGLLEENEQACLAARDTCIANGGAPGADMVIANEAAEELTVDSCRQELELEQCDLTADQVFRCFRDLPRVIETAFGELNCSLAGDEQALQAATTQFGDFDPEAALPDSCAILEDSCFSTSIN